MYNLFSRSISKSKYSIKSLSNICNKISSSKSENTKQKSISDTSMRKGTSNDRYKLLMKKPTYQISKRALLCVPPKEVIKVMMFSTSSSKYFYTTTINQNKAKSGKSANTKGIDVYKKALEEVTKRKFQKKPMGCLFNKVDYKNKTCAGLESCEEKVLEVCKRDIATKEMGRFVTDLNKIKVIYANYKDTRGIMDIFPAINREQEMISQIPAEEAEEAGTNSLKFPNLLYTQRSKKSSKIIGPLKNNKIERYHLPMLRYRESMERLILKNGFLESQKRGMSLKSSNNKVDRETERNSTGLRGVSKKSDIYNDIIKTAQRTDNDTQLAEDYQITNAESRIFTMPVKNIKTKIEEVKQVNLKPDSTHLEDLFNYMKKLEHLQEQILSSSDTRMILRLKKSEQKDEQQKSDLVTPAITENSKKGNTNILEPTQKPLRTDTSFLSNNLLKRIVTPVTSIIKKDVPSSDTYKIYKFANKSKSTKPTKDTNQIGVPKVQQNVTFKSKIRNFIRRTKKYLQNISRFKSKKPAEKSETTNLDKKEAKNVSTSAKVQPKNDSDAQRENNPLTFPATDKKPLIEQMKDSLKTSIESDFKKTFGDSFKDKKKTDLEQSRISDMLNTEDTNIKKLGDLPNKVKSIKKLFTSNDVQTPKTKSELEKSKRMDLYKKASKIIEAEEKEMKGKHSSWLLSKQNYSKEVNKKCSMLSKEKGSGVELTNKEVKNKSTNVDTRQLTSQIKNVVDENKKTEKNTLNIQNAETLSPRKMFHISKITSMSQRETKTDDIPKEESTSTIEKSKRLVNCLFSDEKFRLKMLNDIIDESEENLKSMGKFAKPQKEEIAKLNPSNVETFEDSKSPIENEGLDQRSEDQKMQISNDCFEQPSITPPSVPPHPPPSKKDDKKKKLPPPSSNKGMILPPRNGTVNAKLTSKESQDTTSKNDDLSASTDSKESPKGTEPEKNSDLKKLTTLEDNESLHNKLGFIEELDIKYKDGSDPNLIRQSKQMDKKAETTPNKCHAKSDKGCTESSKNPTSQLFKASDNLNDLEEPCFPVTISTKEENQEGKNVLKTYPKFSLMYFYLLEEDGMPETFTQLTENSESNLTMPQLKENNVQPGLMHFYLLDEDEATESESKNDTTEITELLSKKLKESKLIEEDLLKQDRITKVCSSEKELASTKDDAMGQKNDNKKNIKPTYPTRTFMSMLENRLSKPETTKEWIKLGLDGLSLEEIDNLIKNTKVVEPIKDSTSLLSDFSETTRVNKTYWETLIKNHPNEKLQKDPMLLGNTFGKLGIKGRNCMDLATKKNLQFVSNIYKIDKLAPCDDGFKIISDDIRQTQKQENTVCSHIKRSQLIEPRKSNSKILNPTLASDEDKDKDSPKIKQDKDKDKEKAKSVKKKELTSDKKASDREEPPVKVKITLTRKRRRKAPITVTEDPNKRPIVIVTYSKKKESSEKKEASHKKMAYKAKKKPVTRRNRKFGNREIKGKKKKRRRDIILFLLKEEIKRSEQWHNQLKKKNISPINKIDKAISKYKFKIPTEVSNDFNSLPSADLEMNEKKRIKEKLADKFHRNLHKQLFNSTKIKPAIKSENNKQMSSKETGSTKSKPVLADNIPTGRNYETESNFKKTSKSDSAPKVTDKKDDSDLKPKSMLDGSSFAKTTRTFFQDDFTVSVKKRFPIPEHFATFKKFYTTKRCSKSETFLTEGEDPLGKLKGEKRDVIVKRNYCKIAATSCSNRASNLSSFIPSFRTFFGRKRSPIELKNENKYQRPSKIIELFINFVEQHKQAEMGNNYELFKKIARAKNKISKFLSENSIEDITIKPLKPSEESLPSKHLNPENSKKNELTRIKSEKSFLPKFQSEREEAKMDVPIQLISLERLKNEVDRYNAYTLKSATKTKYEKHFLTKFQSEREKAKMDVPIRIISLERLKNEVVRHNPYTLKYVSKNLNDTNKIFTGGVKDSNLDKEINKKTGGEKQDTDSEISLEQRDNRIVAEILKNWTKQHMKPETTGTNKDAEKEK